MAPRSPGVAAATAAPVAPVAPVDPVAMTAPVELDRPEAGMDLRPDRPWITLVWNDPINLMSYVAYVFRTYFGYDKAEADRLMLAVHQQGRAVVSNGTREEMERDVAAMHGYGLWATLAQDD